MSPAPVKRTPEQTDNDYAKVAQAIQRVGELGKRLSASGLSRRAVLVLLHDATKVPIRDIKLVLDELEALADWALTKARP